MSRISTPRIDRERISDLLTSSSAVVIALSGGLLILYATNHGIGVSPDSVTYIDIARTILNGNGLRILFADGTGSSLTQFPPFYPITLSLFGQLAEDPSISARWVGIFLFVLLILLAWGFIKYASQSTRAAASVALLTCLAMPLITIHSMAWSEGLFLLLGFSSLFLISMYFEQSRWIYFFGSAVIASLVLLTRYAGAGFAAAGILAILGFTQGTTKRRLGLASVYAVITIIPITIWIISNAMTSDNPTGRQFSVHLITRERIGEGLTTLTTWIFVPSLTPSIIKLIILLVCFGSLLAIHRWLIIHGKGAEKPVVNYLTEERGIFSIVMWIFIMAYGVILVLSISFFDANTPLNDRILAPILIALIILSVYLVHRFIDLNKSRLLNFVVGVIFLGIAVGWGARSLGWTTYSHNEGIGFSNIQWKSSEIISSLALLPEDLVLYSNAPDAIRFLARRPAHRLPRKFYLTSQTENLNFSLELEQIAKELEAGEAIIVYFNLPGRQSNPTENEIREGLRVQETMNVSDGKIIGKLPGG